MAGNECVNSVNKYQSFILYLLLLILATTWCIPNTIALRYTSTALILFLLIYKLDFKFKYNDPIIINLLLFIIFLLIYSILSDESYKSFLKIKSEWSKFILYSLTGILLASSSIDKKKLLLVMGLGFSLLNYVYVIYYCLYLNDFRVPFFLEHHGYIAYSSFTSILLLCPLLGDKFDNKKINALILFTIIINFISTIFAESRGGIVFNILILSIYILNYIHIQNFTKMKKLLFYVTLFTLIIIIFSIIVNIKPNKWNNITYIVKIGMAPNSLEILCNGYSDDAVKRDIKTTDYEGMNYALDDLNRGGTAARIMSARAAFELLKYNLSGNKLDTVESYKYALRNFCGRKAKIELANSHNGWLDLFHALGLIGAFLFIFFYVYPLIILFNKARKINDINYWITIGGFIFILSWLLRGILDATLRDHMLEIQSLFIFYFYFLSQSKYGRLKNKDFFQKKYLIRSFKMR